MLFNGMYQRAIEGYQRVGELDPERKRKRSCIDCDRSEFCGAQVGGRFDDA